MNALTITGNLVADPELINLGEGGVLVNFRIGNNEYAGPDKDPYDNGFHDITAFNAQAIRVHDQLSKGDRVVVSGRIQHRTFEREDGTKGGRVTLMAQVVGISLEFEDKS